MSNGLLKEERARPTEESFGQGEELWPALLEGTIKSITKISRELEVLCLVFAYRNMGCSEEDMSL
jgi:hypothetical protein